MEYVHAISFPLYEKELERVQTEADQAEARVLEKWALLKAERDHVAVLQKQVHSIQTYIDQVIFNIAICIYN